MAQTAIDDGEVPARTVMLPLSTNARRQDVASCAGASSRSSADPRPGVVIGGVVVAPIASELILPIAIAVQNRISVNDLAQTFSVYPSQSGSITEAGPPADGHDDLD